MAYDSTHKKAMMFGGVDSVGPNSDTFVFDPVASSWSNPSPNGPPPARYFGSLAFDVTSGVFILYGGQDDTKAYGDTWRYDLSSNSWMKLSPPVAPSPRDRFAYAYDSATRRMFIFGGCQVTANCNAETWAFDVGAGSWTNLNPTSSPPYGWGFAMAFDSNDNKLVLFGGVDSSGPSGETWTYSIAANRWSKVTGCVSPAARYYHAIFPDAPKKRILMFGGQDNGQAFGDTWEYLTDQAPPVLVVAPVASPVSGTRPLEVSFVPGVGGGYPPYSYSWSFGDGQASIDASPKHTFNGSGAFKATLEVTDKCGGQAYGSVTITVNEPPPPGPGPTPPPPISDAALVALAIVFAAVIIAAAILIRRKKESPARQDKELKKA